MTARAPSDPLLSDPVWLAFQNAPISAEPLTPEQEAEEARQIAENEGKPPIPGEVVRAEIARRVALETKP